MPFIFEFKRSRQWTQDHHDSGWAKKIQRKSIKKRAENSSLSVYNLYITVCIFCSYKHIGYHDHSACAYQYIELGICTYNCFRCVTKIKNGYVVIAVGRLLRVAMFIFTSDFTVYVCLGANFDVAMVSL